MADYSAQATALTPAQGAGTQPVAPTDSYRPLEGGQRETVRTVTEMLVHGVNDYTKAAALDRKNTVVGQYIKNETAIGDAVASGQMSAAEASARSRSNFSKHAANYGEYINDFEQAGKALRGFGEAGIVQDKLKAEQENFQKDIDLARSKGAIIPEDMAPDRKRSQIDAVKTAMRLHDEKVAFYADRSNTRADNQEQRVINDRDAKVMEIRAITDLAGSNIPAFQDMIRDLSDRVRKDPAFAPQAISQLNTRYSNISATIQAAAAVNPELAAPYRSLFESIYTVGQKGVDPKNSLDEMEAQFKMLVTQTKLVAITDPKFRATVVVNQLLPNNAGLSLGASATSIEAIARLSSTPLENNLAVPKVIGDATIEGQTFDLLKGGIDSISSGKVQDKPKAIEQASNSANHLLIQAGHVLDQGAKPKDLLKIADFVASPQYAYLLSQGKIDKQASEAAHKTFQILYEPTIVNDVGSRLNTQLFTSKTSLNGKAVPLNVGDTLNVQFSGSGIQFTPDTKLGLSPAEQRQQRIAVDSLKSSSNAINQLIHIGAHMEGSTDYAKYWEDNKHLYLPSVYPDPVQLKPGAVVDGYKYTGGAWRNRNNWVKVQESSSNGGKD